MSERSHVTIDPAKPRSAKEEQDSLESSHVYDEGLKVVSEVDSEYMASEELIVNSDPKKEDPTSTAINTRNSCTR